MTDSTYAKHTENSDNVHSTASCNLRAATLIKTVNRPHCTVCSAVSCCLRSGRLCVLPGTRSCFFGLLELTRVLLFTADLPCFFMDFVEILPRPYRVVALVNVAVALWYTIILTCIRCEIDLLMVVRLKHPDLTLRKLALATRSTMIKMTTFNAINYALYLIFYIQGLNMPLLNWFPLISLVYCAMILYTPEFFSNNSQPSVEGQRLSQTFRRVLKGEIDTSIRNNDIILTDTLTSYNKTIIDLLIYISGLLLGMQVLPLTPGEMAKDHLQVYNLDLMLANFPSALRLKQCLYEYKASSYANRIHLFNAIKYSTAFLPTICMILMRQSFLKSNYAWILYSLINSSYSFFWDISNDWNFGFFYRYIKGNKDLPIFRSHLIYNSKFYYLAILVDFSLRFIWVFKVLASPPIDSGFMFMMYSLFNTESGSFFLQLLEICRRWVWIFIKVETEYIKMISIEENIELDNQQSFKRES